MTRHAATIAFAAMLITGQVRAASIDLAVGGSAVLAPLFRIWAADYANLHPEVALTITATGSSRGTADALAGVVDIGAADTFLSDAEARAHPGVVNVALANSAVAVVTAVPGLKAPLKLDGPTLWAIYRGAIRFWDDRAIAELNPEAALPHRDIVTVRRAENAAETFAFAQYLATAPSEDDYGTLEAPLGTRGEKAPLRNMIAVPSRALPSQAVPSRDGARAARDDDEMMEILARTPYAIGYVAYPFVGEATRQHLSVAALRNQADEYLLPDVVSINRAAAALTLRTPVDERISLVDAPGTGCYPLISLEYAVVALKQPNPARALALRDFLNWAIARDVASFERIEAAHLVALRSSTWLASLSQIDLIH